MGFKEYLSVRIFVSLVVGVVSASAQIQDTLTIPQQTDWVDEGIVLRQGPPGSWDVRLYGMISPCSLVKKNGTYFLYYLGADGNRLSDRGPRHRALGVATSIDGINFTKYSGNPLITFLPNNNEEEGVFSAAAILDSNSNVILYYGAMNAGSPTSGSVHADVRLATSSDGYNFSDQGVVLDHNDGSVWNSGDELYPLGTFYYDGMWFLYYTSNHWELGLAWGTSPFNLPSSDGVIDSGDDIIGGGDPVWIEPEKIAIFTVRDFNSNYIEAYTAPANIPGQVSAPTETYSFGGHRHMTIFFDPEKSAWFMYHRQTEGNNIRLRIVQLSGSDMIPSLAPTGLNATGAGFLQVDLSWNPSTDPESGISYYKIYRDSLYVGQSVTTSYSDTDLSAGTIYAYEVSAVNGVGLESTRSLPDTAMTFLDVTAPSTPAGVNAVPVSASQIDLDWNESIDPETGISYYNIYRDNNVVGQTSQLIFNDTALNPGVTYVYEVSAVNGVGLESLRSEPDTATTFITSLSNSIRNKVPGKFILFQNYPNPFNPNTVIKYQVPKAGRVQLAIFNALGERIKTLVDDNLSPGVYSASWNGTNATSQAVVSGVYFCHLVLIGNRLLKEDRKMLLLR